MPITKLPEVVCVASRQDDKRGPTLSGTPCPHSQPSPTLEGSLHFLMPQTTVDRHFRINRVEGLGTAI